MAAADGERWEARGVNLTDEQIIDIRLRYAAGEQPHRIARDYGVHSRTAYRAATCRTHWRRGWDPVIEAREIAATYRPGGEYHPDVYGTCLVDDPRLFSPDAECATPADLYAWADAVRAVDAGADIGNPGYGGWSEDGRVHIMRTTWGLGVNWIASAAGGPRRPEASE